MVSVKQAQKIILQSILPLKDSETIEFSSCLERILAQDIKSKENIPAFDNSAMDGFAVRAVDTQGASWKNPKILEVIQDLAAGYVSRKTIQPGEAIRIMTGAALPKGADSVVMVEDTKHQTPNTKDLTPEYIEIFKEVKKGENVRYAGEDVKKGEVVIKKGAILKSGHIGMLASLGIAKVKVSRQPKVAILATGDELIRIKDKLKPGKIRNSNTYALSAQVIKACALPILLGIARDTRIELKNKIKKGLDSDILLVSGGISVGDYDFVKDVLAELGAEFKFWKVAMRPGKPLAFGMIKKIPVFGLPGNPVSSMVSFELFVRPAIWKMSGRKEDDREEVEAVLGEEIKKKKNFKYFLRAKTHWQDGGYVTKTTGLQGSAILKSMCLANSLIILPKEQEFFKKGQRVKIKFLD